MLWSQLIRGRLTVWQIVFVVSALGICLVLRPHYAIAAGWLLVSAATISLFPRSARWILPAAFVVLIGLIFTFAWQELLVPGYGASAPDAHASRHAIFGIVFNSIETKALFECLVPLYAIFGIIGPFPQELLRRPEFIPFFLEGLAILVFPAIIFACARKRGLLDDQSFLVHALFGVAPALLLLVITHAPFGFLNLGSAIRWRANFEPIFYLAPLLLLFNAIDARKNRPLPS